MYTIIERVLKVTMKKCQICYFALLLLLFGISYTDDHEEIDEFDNMPEGEDFDFKSSGIMNISEFIELVSDASGKKYIYNPQDLDFEITLDSQRTTSYSLESILYSILDVNDLFATEVDGKVFIQKMNFKNDSKSYYAIDRNTFPMSYDEIDKIIGISSYIAFVYKYDNLALNRYF